MADSAAIRQTLLSVLASQFPDIAFKNNILDRLLVQPATAIYGYLQDEISKKLAAVNLQDILEDKADEEAALSFFKGLGISISNGSFANGFAHVILTDGSVITVPKETRFRTANGLEFVSTELIRAIPSEEYRTSPDDQLMSRFGSYWSFQVPLKAVEVGAKYNIQENTELTTTLQIPNLYSILSSLFYGGTNAETAKDVANRLIAGLGMKGLANNGQILALLKSPSDNPYYDNQLQNTISVSTVGANDAEMQRDRRGILPVSIGGKIDIYVRTARQPLLATKRITARLIDINSNGNGIWEFVIARSLCPVAYRAVQVRPLNSLPSDPGYEITSQTVSLDLSNTGFPFVPDIANTIEGAFSSFCKITVDFIDTDTRVEPGQIGNRTQDYYATIQYMPAIDAAQKYLSCDQIRPIGLDVLVKAPFLCFTSVVVSLTKNVSTEVKNRLKGKIAEFINLRDFRECIYASSLSAQIAGLLPPDTGITNITIGGSILLPYLTTYTINPSTSLCIPTLNNYGISAKNTIFVQTTDQISFVVS